jgi:Tol biopolymer transport system component
MTDVRFQDGQGYTHLLRLDLESGQLIDLTGDGTAGDSWASWSPQGEWVAVVRTEYGTSQISTGDQIWIMRSDGSEAHPVTDDSNVIHGLPIWSPDGNYLLIQQYSLMEASAQSELWLLNVETQERQKLTVVGSSPAWLY